MEDTGLVSVASSQNVPLTVAKFTAAAKQAGITIFGQRNFSQAAEDGKPTRPTIVILFGNANVIQGLVNSNQQLAIDFPMRLLVCETPDGVSRVNYTDPRWLINRHGMSQQLGGVADKMAAVLTKLVTSACAKEVGN